MSDFDFRKLFNSGPIAVDAGYPITIVELPRIKEAIDFYEQRTRLLKIVLNEGFDTLEEYAKFKIAEETVAKHKKKMEENDVKKAEETVAKHKEKTTPLPTEVS
uniref:Uncharacterized protein n=1 Tax=Marseillevirus LCMAC102 TaxID=2506603 RepID=A0A481YTW4_9VIRU|nr:MAG: uncharacterized protein LCMAC102_02750 [Marseillevirus LCMAC102]